jgi:signal transduction histidine kinase
MSEAIRCGDYTFRLSEKGMLPGQRDIVRTLNAINQRVGEAISRSEVKSWERLMRTLTHEIVNATAPISSISQAMMRRADVRGTSLEEGVQAIHSAAQHLGTLVANYRHLTLSQRPHMRRVEVIALMVQVKALYPNMQWQIQGQAELAVYTDPELLRQVVVNIVKNAAEAQAQRIGIEVVRPSSTTDAARLHIFVSNDGTPIAPESQAALFVPFFTTKAAGSGIGLSLSRQIMVQLGGDITLAATPRPPYITTFQINLPLGQA